METKGYRFYGCLSLICAIGLAISLGTSVANSKMPLSDEAMSGVYGGSCGTGPCDAKTPQGCNTPTGNTLCNYRSVEPTSACTSPNFQQTCKRDQEQCGNRGEGSCTDGTASCPTQVAEKTCYIDGSDCKVGSKVKDINCDTGSSTYATCTVD